MSETKSRASLGVPAALVLLLLLGFALSAMLDDGPREDDAPAPPSTEIATEQEPKASSVAGLPEVEVPAVESEPQDPQPGEANSSEDSSSPMPRMGAAVEEEPLELPEIDWAALPESARAEAFEASVETLSDWIAEIDPQYDAQLLGTDCSAPPCLVGMAFDGRPFGDDHATKAEFQGRFAQELERLRGERPAMTMVTATPDGTTAVWVYELPGTGEDREAMHGGLNESARLRHQQWVAAWSSARAGRVAP